MCASECVSVCCMVWHLVFGKEIHNEALAVTARPGETLTLVSFFAYMCFYACVYVCVGRSSVAIGKAKKEVCRDKKKL